MEVIAILAAEYFGRKAEQDLMPVRDSLTAP